MVRPVAWLIVVSAMALLGVAPASRDGGPPLQRSPAELERTLVCSGDLARAPHSPVILIHAFTSNPRESWQSGYLYALVREGFPTCTVELPERAMGDIQESTEYVVFAIRRVAELSGRQVTLIGHSEGGLLPVWALRFWPDLRGRVADVVGIASPYQGTEAANRVCAWPAGCPPAAWQQRRGARFIEALNLGPLPTGPAYTSISTLFDEIVFPQPEASRLDGATHIVLQQVCPGRPIDHYGTLYDNLTYELVLDALRYDGPADPSRLPANVCATVMMPTEYSTFTPNSGMGLANVPLVYLTSPAVGREPDLFCYADPASQRGVGTYC